LTHFLIHTLAGFLAQLHATVHDWMVLYHIFRKNARGFSKKATATGFILRRRSRKHISCPAGGACPAGRRLTVPSRNPQGRQATKRASPPNRFRNGKVSRWPAGQAPQRAPTPQVQPVPPPAQARGCKGRSPLAWN